jgi:hypothetical protein
MRDVYEIRRTNLRLLIDQWGGPLPLAKKLGYKKASFMVQMAGLNPTREVTEKSARRIEEVLELPAFWMDNEVNLDDTMHGVDLAIVSASIRAVAQEATGMDLTLSPVKLADIVLLVTSDAEKNNNTIRPEYIKTLLNLMM